MLHFKGSGNQMLFGESQVGWGWPQLVGGSCRPGYGHWRLLPAEHC